MVLTVTIKGLGSLTEAEDETNWASVSIAAETLEEDVVLQGTYAVSAQASKKAGELYYDINTEFGRDLDFDVGGTEENQLIFMWISVTTLGALDVIADRGLAIRLYTNLTDWADYTIAGSDNLDNFRGKKGGYVCFALDPRLPPTFINGTWDSGAIELMGVHIETTESAKTQNLQIDHITVGEGVYIVGTGTFEDMADYCNAFASRAWGMIQYDDTENVIYSMGKVFIGSGNQEVITRIPDADRIIQFTHTEYYTGGAWYPMVPTDYHEIIVEDNVTYPTEWIDGVQVGDDRGRNGSLIRGDSGAVDLRLQLSGSNSSSYVKLYGTTLKYAEGGVTGSEDVDYSMFSVTMDNCGQLDPLGAMKIRESTFSNTLDDSGAVLWRESMSLLGGNFIANSFGIQVDHTGAITVSGSQFSANTYDGFLTVSTGLLTVNTTNSNIANFQSGVDTEVSIINSVTVAVSVVDQGNIAISGVRYGVYETGGTILDSGMTDSDGIFSFPYNYLGNLDIDIVLRRSSAGLTKYFPQSNPGVIQAGGFSAKYTMIEDTIA
jgi:hypothetical protein